MSAILMVSFYGQYLNSSLQGFKFILRSSDVCIRYKKIFPQSTHYVPSVRSASIAMMNFFRISERDMRNVSFVDDSEIETTSAVFPASIV